MRIITKTNLNPCPRCGESWLYHSDKFAWTINCKCGLAWHLSGWYNTKNKARKYWNKYITKGLKGSDPDEDISSV